MFLRSIRILLLLHSMCALTSAYYCSSKCIDSTGACFDETPNGCWACAQYIYEIPSNHSNSYQCQLADQRAVVVDELPNTMTSIGDFNSNNPTPFAVSNYTLSGKYSNSDWIQGNFTGFRVNHHRIVIRFAIGHLGLWNQTDQIKLQVRTKNQNLTFNFNYSCLLTHTDLTGTGHGDWECIRIREVIIHHNSSYVYLKWTANYHQSDPNAQSWGVKQLLIAQQRCNSYCQTCYGDSVNSCLKCSAGYFLQGNTCVRHCDPSFYSVSDMRMCVGTCPSKFFSNVASSGALECLRCMDGCALCSSAGRCQAWIDQTPYSPDLWKDKMEFWILLIILLVGALVALVYCLIKRKLQKTANQLEQNFVKSSEQKSEQKKQKNKKVDSQSNQHRQAQIIPLPNDSILKSRIQSLNNTLDANDALWFNELVEMDPVEVQVRGRRRQRKNKEQFEFDVKDMNQIAKGTDDHL